MPLARPVVVFSRCLGFAPCRYNGQTIVEAEVEALKPHLDVLTVCPEVGTGLGVPRDPLPPHPRARLVDLKRAH
jgi:uncharacterized protein YbbK (DUF523 family)